MYWLVESWDGLMFDVLFRREGEQPDDRTWNCLATFRTSKDAWERYWEMIDGAPVDAPYTSQEKPE